MRSSRQFILVLYGTIVLAMNYRVTYEQDNITTDEQRTIKSTLPMEMKITSWNDMPFSGLVKKNGTWIGEGYAFYLLELLSSKLNFTYTIVPPKQHILGNKKTGIMSLLYEKKVDMAVAFLPTLPELRQYCTFSVALDESLLKVLMKRPQESATGSGLLAPFDNTVWLLVLAAVIFVGPVIYISAALRAKLWKDPDSENYTLPSCAWFVYSSLLKQGTNIVATTDTTRILFATWWMFILILTSFYTANLTAFLTKPQFTLPINSLEDIVRKGYKWIAYKGRTVDFLLSQDHQDELSLLNATKWRGRYISTYEYPMKDILQAVDKNRLFFGEIHYLQTIIFKDYINKTRKRYSHEKRCTYVIMPNPILTTNTAFAFPLNSSLQKLINKELTAIVESGIVKRAKLKDLPLAEVCPVDLRSTERQLTNSDLSLTYKVVVAGYIIATTVFILEVTYRLTINSYKRKRKTGKLAWTLRSVSKQNSKDSVIPKLVYITKNHMLAKRNTERISVKRGGNPQSLQQNNASGLFKPRKHCVNGRDYYVVIDNSGDQRLIPIRTPSAFLFQYTV